jgi:hypothetical protein
MDFRKLSLAAAALVTLAPVLASANPEDAALSSCVRAFADKINTPGAATPTVKIAYPQKHAGSSVADYYARNFTFTMSARKSGAEVAQATCQASAHGEVLSLVTSPQSLVATLAAR